MRNFVGHSSLIENFKIDVAMEIFLMHNLFQVKMV